MNTLPMLLIMTVVLFLLAVFAPRSTEPRAGIGEAIIRGFFRWARFWWAFAVALQKAQDAFIVERERIKIVPENCEGVR
jgi:hypothetical protein